MAGEGLDQDAKEPLHRPADGTMDHHRLRLLRMLVDIEGTEAFRQIEVDLGRAALPFPSDRVAKRILELRTIERTFAGQDAGLDAIARLRLDRLQDIQHDAFGAIPERI